MLIDALLQRLLYTGGLINSILSAWKFRVMHNRFFIFLTFLPSFEWLFSDTVVHVTAKPAIGLGRERYPYAYSYTKGAASAVRAPSPFP